MDDIALRLGMLEDREAIASLNYRYARLVDSGRFEEFAELFAHGSWRDCIGAGEVLTWLRQNVRLYGETPRTNHLVSGLEITINGDRATGISTIVVSQQLPGSKDVFVITVNDYADEYIRIDGEWRFASRQVKRRLEGDMSGHLTDQTRLPT